MGNSEYIKRSRENRISLGMAGRNVSHFGVLMELLFYKNNKLHVVY